MSTLYTVREGKNRGKQITLLNPHEKAGKAKYEKARGCHMTNAGDVKRDERGKIIPLTNGQKVYRAGYVRAHRDMVAAYAPKAKKAAFKKDRAALKSGRIEI